MNWRELLFHTPWWLPTAIIAVGVILFFMGNSRREWRVRAAGAIALLLAVALILVSYFVETNIERVTRETHEVVESVQKRDWRTMRVLLDQRASLAGYGNRDQIVSGAQKSVEEFGLKEVHTLSTTVKQDDSVITVTLKVWTEQDYTQGRPLSSTWQFEWQQALDGRWSLMTITPLEVGGKGPEELLARLPRP